MLAARAAAEVLVGDEDVARLDLADEPGVEVLHAVLGELGRVARVEVARRDDDVGVDVSAVLVGVSGELHELLLDAARALGHGLYQRGGTISLR